MSDLNNKDSEIDLWNSTELQSTTETKIIDIIEKNVKIKEDALNGKYLEFTIPANIGVLKESKAYKVRLPTTYELKKKCQNIIFIYNDIQKAVQEKYMKMLNIDASKFMSKEGQQELEDAATNDKLMKKISAKEEFEKWLKTSIEQFNSQIIKSNQLRDATLKYMGLEANAIDVFANLKENIYTESFFYFYVFFVVQKMI